jgi:hypothetical protein
MPNYDFFVSHASEDKEAVARPLAQNLRAKGLSVWYDEFTLQPGDSLREFIDKGIRQSRFGVIILSPSFFRKAWPKTELAGIHSVEILGTSKIIPIWHNVTYDQVAKMSPILADKVALHTSNGISKVASELEKMIPSRIQVENHHSFSPRNIKINKNRGPFHTQLTANFEMEYCHEITYERSERVVGGDIRLSVDGREIFNKRLYEIFLGSTTHRFEIEGATAVLSIIGFGVGFSVKCRIGNIDVFKL